MLHSWKLTPKEAVALQRELADKVDHSTPLGACELVAGADCSYNRFSPWFYAAVVVLKADDGTIVDKAEAVGKSPFPYVPGLLSFREAPIILEAFAKLTHRPDVVLVDGQGRAHPRRIGVASHLGLWLGIPTIGCAKTKLIGDFKDPARKAGSYSPLMIDDEQVGVVLRTKDGVKPLYISPGHGIDLESSIRTVLSQCRGYRQPEPTRLAHQVVNDLRKRMMGKHDNEGEAEKAE
ncbi:MAG: deoxyribonuclease V [Gemmataceae bacterium]